MKKFISLICLLSLCLSSVALASEQAINEHMFTGKNAYSDRVVITNIEKTICRGNSFEVAFNSKFKSEAAKAGDLVNFDIKDAIYTKEGTLLIPAGSKMVGTIIKIQKQRIPNKNARVYINFNSLIFPDGSAIVMRGLPATKDNTLKEGPWMTTGRLALYALGLGCVGAGAGVGFAFIPSPAKIAVGLGVGIPVGVTVGLIIGLVTPGLKYHAKSGECIEVILSEPLVIPNKCEK